MIEYSRSAGLVSEWSEVHVAASSWPVTAMPRLAWNPRSDEGWTLARVYQHTALGGASELAAVRGSTFLHADVKPGGRYRYSVQLERSDGTKAPMSSPVEISIPDK